MSTPPLDLFRRLTSGVYVITASDDGRSDGFTAAWVTQVSFEPLLLAISINAGHATWPLIESSRRCAINVLGSTQQDLARHFGLTSGRMVDKLATVRTFTSPDGFVGLAEAVCWLGCRVEQQIPAGDHIVVVVQAVAGELLDTQATPLRYSETGNMDGSAELYPARFPG